MADEKTANEQHAREQQRDRDRQQTSDKAREQALAEGKERADHIRKEGDARMKGKPTPTQEENDRAKLGEHITEHEADGSDPDPNVEQQRRALEGGKPGDYKTRESTTHTRETQQRPAPAPRDAPKG